MGTVSYCCLRMASICSRYLCTVAHSVVVSGLDVQTILWHLLPVEAVVVRRNGNQAVLRVQVERSVQVAEDGAVAYAAAQPSVHVGRMHLSGTAEIE